MSLFDDHALSFAVDAVDQACRVARRVQDEMTGESLTKADRSPVTVADFAVQAVIGRLLEQAFPDAALVGEEDATALRADDMAAMRGKVTAYVRHAAPDATEEQVLAWIDRGNGAPEGRFWTLDPIDGTKGFLRGEQYAVALALIDGGAVQLGVLGCPNLAGAHRPERGGPGTLLAAKRGEGAWAGAMEGERNWQQVRVSDIADPAQARILRSAEAGHTNVDRLDRLAQLWGVEAEPVRMDSQAKYAVLAAGHGDVLFRLLNPAKQDYREKIWDQAAGSIVLEEAGGRITDLAGRPLDFSQGRTLANNSGVLATNGRLHDSALEALRREPAEA